MFRDRREGVEVRVGEILDAFVEKVRGNQIVIFFSLSKLNEMLPYFSKAEDNKINIALRPVDLSRISSVKAIVLDALEGSPSNIIPVGKYHINRL